MIDVCTANTFHGVKVPIALEELGVPYRVARIDLGAQQQKSTEFLRLNPNGRIPVIVDHDVPAGAPLSVFESGAILWYSVADIMNFGWLREAPCAGVRLADYPAVHAWIDRIAARPAVLRGLQAIA